MRESLMAYCLRTGKPHLLREWLYAKTSRRRIVSLSPAE